MRNLELSEPSKESQRLFCFNCRLPRCQECMKRTPLPIQRIFTKAMVDGIEMDIIDQVAEIIITANLRTLKIIDKKSSLSAKDLIIRLGIAVT